MRRRRAALGSAAFFLVAPVVVAGLVPWLLTGWEVGGDPGAGLAVRVLGGALVGFGLAVLVPAFVRFVREGSGTPAPVAPTERLVVGGWYRYVRNPMYVAVELCILGQAALLVQSVLVVYGAAAGLVMATFVHVYEEPNLARRFGTDYARYRAAVPAWRPRLHPWQPDGG